MTMFSKTTMLALALVAGITGWAGAANATIILYSTSGGAQQTNSGSYVPMPGLQLTLPAAAGNSNYALIMLDVPNPYAVGSNSPGANFAISVNGVVQPMIACFTTDIPNSQPSGRHPTTLIIRVPLTSSPQQVKAMWLAIRNSTVRVDTPNSLSAILE